MITIAFAELKTLTEGSPDVVVPEAPRPGGFGGSDSADSTADMAADSFVSFMLEQAADSKKPEPAMGQGAEIAQTHGEGRTIRIERAETLPDTMSGQAAMTVEAASDQTNIMVKPHSSPVRNGRPGVESAARDAVFIKEHSVLPEPKSQAALISPRSSTVASGQMPIQNSPASMQSQAAFEGAGNVSPTESTDPVAPVSATTMPGTAIVATAGGAYWENSNESVALRSPAALQIGVSGQNDPAHKNRIRSRMQIQATVITPAQEIMPLAQPEQPGSVLEMPMQQDRGQTLIPSKAIKINPAEPDRHQQVFGGKQPIQEIAAGKTQNPPEPVKQAMVEAELQRLGAAQPDRFVTPGGIQSATGSPNRQTTLAEAEKAIGNPRVSEPEQNDITRLSNQTLHARPNQSPIPSQTATGPDMTSAPSPSGAAQHTQPQGQGGSNKHAVSAPEGANHSGVVSSPQMADEPPRGPITLPDRQPLPRQGRVAAGRSGSEGGPEIAARAVPRPSIGQNREIIQDTQEPRFPSDRNAPAVVVQKTIGHSMPGKMPQNGDLAQIASPPGGAETPGFTPHSDLEPQQDEPVQPRSEMADFNKNRPGQEAWFTMNSASKMPQAEIGLASPGLLDHAQPEIGHSELHLSELTGIEPARVSHDISTARPEMARHVAQQLADAVRQMPDRPVEVTLNPEELGRVRLTFTISENGINLAVLSERGETMDLLRRHIDILAQEFREMGYQDVSFDFSSQSQHQAHDQDGDANPTDQLSASVLEHDQPASPKPSQQPASGLDLRL